MARILIALDLDDADLTAAYGDDLDVDDLYRSLEARLEEVYLGTNPPVPAYGRLVTVGDVTDVLPEFLDAAERGARTTAVTMAVGGHITGTVATMREFLD